MKLAVLIEILQNPHDLNQLLTKKLDNLQFDFVDLYMESDLNIDSKIILIDTERIFCNGSVLKDKGLYVNLIPLNLLSELIVYHNQSANNKLSNMEIALAILKNRENGFRRNIL